MIGYEKKNDSEEDAGDPEQAEAMSKVEEEKACHACHTQLPSKTCFYSSLVPRFVLEL